MKLYLQRHALTDEGPQMSQSRTINDIGDEQAHVMRKFLKHADVSPDVIICSDFARAEDTAKIMQRGDTPIKTTPFLRPSESEFDDKSVPAAWKSILKLAGDAKSVLVVTHSPLVQRLLASVAFNFQDEKWGWEHAAIAYINTHESRFRWFVTPKLAAHLVGKDPVEVENPVGEAAFARSALALAEHLRREHRAQALDPLIAKVKGASASRFNRQKLRVIKALKVHKKQIDMGTANYGEVRQAVQNAIPFSDAKFAKIYDAAMGHAHDTGYTHAGEMLNLFWEAAKIQPPGKPKRTAQELEGELDDTTDKQTGDKLKDAFDPTKPLTYAAIVAGVRQQFSQYSNGIDGQRSRADTIALSEVSGAYHNAGIEAAKQAPGAVKKEWDIGPEACELCEGNAADGEIDVDDTFSSGDDAPPAHPNCDCSVNYRSADASS